MFGWRKRIGYITPTVMEVVPYEFYRFAPEGIGLCGVTCAIEGLSAAEFDKGLALVEAAAAYLGSREVDFIVHGGAPLVASRGPGFESELVARIETAAGGVPATTNVVAVKQGLEALGAKRVALASPYPQAQHERGIAHLEGQGFSVVPTRGMDVPFKKMQQVSPETIADHCIALISGIDGLDALVVSCPQWQAAQAVEAIERTTGVTVVAASHANFFVAFRALAIGDPIRGQGRLLALLSDTNLH